VKRNASFWISMGVFQVVFALAIFGITRQYYLDGDNAELPAPSVVNEPAFEWVNRLPEINTALLETSQDPAEISRQADAYFVNKQYSLAADLYERLLSFDQNNVDVYNNLGLTLHYLGKSTEALRRLDEGVSVDPTYQRIWLTLGYVSSQLGQTERARTALTTAVGMDADSQVGQSAARMLESLPNQ